ncbi:hypothetical protein [Kitasatospora sp. NPDC057015]|uniref:hypothetical protein n=1 Tax=Kitasatospora sp. NPDC057015 TaxID=3346001 RepID=UPI003639F021
MNRDVRFVRDLVARIPAFDDLYRSHVFNEDGVLAHVIFWDITLATVASYLGDEDEPDWRSTLPFLEEQLSLGVPEISEVVVTSFLNYLPWPGEPGHGIVRELGPAMARSFASIRPSG